MARSRRTFVRAGDTDPLEITVGATDLSNLDELSSAKLYARKQGAVTNHVNGVACTGTDSAAKTLRFDPVGAGPSGADAFATGDEGTYDCYVLLTWNDEDQTRSRRQTRGRFGPTWWPTSSRGLTGQPGLGA